MNHVTVEWVNEEGAYIVRQNSEFIGDFTELVPACEYALAVAGNFNTYVEIIAVNPNA